jgi:hypothetical protein
MLYHRMTDYLAVHSSLSCNDEKALDHLETRSAIRRA